jgi:hypothetical protein
MQFNTGGPLDNGVGKTNLREHINECTAEILQVAAEIHPGPNWTPPLHVGQDFPVHVTAGRGIKVNVASRALSWLVPLNNLRLAANLLWKARVSASGLDQDPNRTNLVPVLALKLSLEMWQETRSGGSVLPAFDLKSNHQPLQYQRRLGFEFGNELQEAARAALQHEM